VRRTGSRDGLLWANVRGLLGLALSFVGVLASLRFCYFHNIEGQASLLVMTIGIVSPALVFYLLGLMKKFLGGKG
jgi:hypothetical protein